MDFNLNRLFNPKTVAIYGGGWGENVITQLKKMSFTGKIWPVHPYKKTIAGIQCFKNTSELPSGPDASFIGVNRRKTPKILKELSDIGSGGAVCFASGFSETTSQDETGKGTDLQNKLLDAAKNMPILGPNCYGFINYLDGKLLWPDQHGGEKVSSGVAIITQSSNIAINITMQTRKLPIAYVVTTGNQSQLSQAEIAYKLIDDPRVTSLGLHVEGILSPKDFERLSIKAKEKQKGIVVIKVGKSELAKEATASHTASMAGNHKAAAALFNRVGMALVETIEDFLNTLLILHLNGPIFGNKIASLSCSGGEASLIADLVEPTLLEFPLLSGTQISGLKKSLGSLVHLSNPLDYQTYIWNDQKKLLALLQKNADLPLSEISRRIGISTTPCWNRIKKLEERGIIKHKVSVLDKVKAGFPVTVFLSITVSNHNSDWYTRFEEAVVKHGQIMEVHRLTGSSVDYLLKIIAKSIEDYDVFQQKLIAEIQFTSMASSISLKEIKSSHAIPL